MYHFYIYWDAFYNKAKAKQTKTPPPIWRVTLIYAKMPRTLEESFGSQKSRLFFFFFLFFGELYQMIWLAEKTQNSYHYSLDLYHPDPLKKGHPFFITVSLGIDLFSLCLFTIKHLLSASLFQPDACKIFTEGQMCWPSSWLRCSREMERKPRLPITRGYTKTLAQQQGKHTQTHAHTASKSLSTL